MIRIIIASRLDKTLVTVEHDQAVAGSAYGRSQHWHSLSYTLHDSLGHDETGMLADMIHRALQDAEERAAGLGGWSSLA